MYPVRSIAARSATLQTGHVETCLLFQPQTEPTEEGQVRRSMLNQEVLEQADQIGRRRMRVRRRKMRSRRSRGETGD
jgi:hypothetical protein